MAGFYAEMAQAARDILTPDEDGGLGAEGGTVKLVRWTLTPGANSWDDPTETSEAETLLAQVFGVSAEFVGLPATEPANGVIVASDRVCICAVPTIAVQPGDTVTVDGRPVTVLRVQQIPAAGTPVAFRLFIRGG